MSSSAATACNVGALTVRLNRVLDRLDLAAQAPEADPQFALMYPQRDSPGNSPFDLLYQGRVYFHSDELFDKLRSLLSAHGTTT